MSSFYYKQKYGIILVVCLPLLPLKLLLRSDSKNSEIKIENSRIKIYRHICRKNQGKVDQPIDSFIPSLAEGTLSTCRCLLFSDSMENAV